MIIKCKVASKFKPRSYYKTWGCPPAEIPSHYQRSVQLKGLSNDWIVSSPRGRETTESGRGSERRWDRWDRWVLSWFPNWEMEKNYNIMRRFFLVHCKSACNFFTHNAHHSQFMITYMCRWTGGTRTGHFGVRAACRGESQVGVCVSGG